VDTVRRQIERALNRDMVNCLVFQIDAFGGPDSVRPADELAKVIQERNQNILTIAYIPSRASGAAAYIAFACSEIVMGAQQGAEAVIECESLARRNREERAGPGRRPVINREWLPSNEVEPNRQRLVQLAAEQGHPEVLVRALMDPALEIVRVEAKPRLDGRPPAGPPEQQFMARADFEKQQEQWNLIKGPPLKKLNDLLRLNAHNAFEWGIARHKLESPSEDSLLALYGIERRNVVHLRTDWLDELAYVLRHPIATVFLVIVGFTCLILEFKAPGLGLPAILAAVCFILVFWAQSWLSGEVNSLAILLFLLGLVLLGVELFILPGFGITGISGIVLILLSLSLVAVRQWPTSPEGYVEMGEWLGLFVMGLLASMFAAYAVARYLPHIPYANRLVLPSPDEETSDAGATLPPAQSPALLGAIGVAVTTLRPAGKARFGEEFIDVTAEGHYVEAGSRIQVIEIDGLRVVVKAV
jgi:membrane-bound ClpP family serine protease